MATVEEILNTQIPRPTWSLRPGYNTPLPDEVAFSRTSSGYAPDPASGRYASVSSGKKRIYGPNQKLLVEADGRTNFVEWSSDLSQWSNPSGSLGSSVPSIINDGNATAYPLGGSGRIETNAGNTSSGNETVSVFVQEDTASKVRIAWKDTSLSASAEVAVDFDFGADSFSTHDERGGTLKDTGFSEVGSNGSGARVLKLSFRVTPDASGNTRVLRIYGNAETGNGETIIHHAQLEEKPSATSPIVTGSSNDGRNADDVSVDLQDVFNSKEGTLSAVFTPLFSYFSAPQVLAGLPGGSKDYLYISGRFPKDLTSFDGTSKVNVTNSISKLQKNKVAISFTPDERRLAANGEVKVGSHNGDLLNGSTLEIGRIGRLQAAIDNIAYRSRALSASALETLTTGSAKGSTSVVSPPIFVSDPLLQETKDFRDRVYNSGGSIESGSLDNLYDPILRRAKDWGLLSNLVLFMSASAVENNSGSIVTLFDASGDKNDTTQNDTAKQLALNKSGIGGHWEADGDGSDDEMKTPVVPDNCTVISVGTIVGTDSAITGAPYIYEKNGSWAIYDGSGVTGGSHDTDVHDFAARFDGSASHLRVDGAEVTSGDTGGGTSENMFIMGSPYDGRINSGVGLLWLVFNGTTLTTSQEDNLRGIARNYYSL